jgi:hypothetical protein
MTKCKIKTIKRVKGSTVDLRRCDTNPNHLLITRRLPSPFPELLTDTGKKLRRFRPMNRTNASATKPANPYDQSYWNACCAVAWKLPFALCGLSPLATLKDFLCADQPV